MINLHFYDFSNDDTSTEYFYKEDILNFKQSMDSHLTTIFFYISLIKWIFYIIIIFTVLLIIFVLYKYFKSHNVGSSRQNLRYDLLSLNDLATRYLLRRHVSNNIESGNTDGSITFNNGH